MYNGYMSYLLYINLGRVHKIMRTDSNKDPATSPQALLAKVLIDQVGSIIVLAFLFSFLSN